MSYTISNQSPYTYIVGNFVLKGSSSLTTDRLDYNLIDFINNNADVTVYPQYSEDFSPQYDDTFVYTSTTIDVSALTDYPSLTSANATLAQTYTLLIKNSESLKASIVELQKKILEISNSINKVSLYLQNKPIDVTYTSAELPTNPVNNPDIATGSPIGLLLAICY